MTDATISRVRMRDLARRGRYRPARRACASRRESGPEAFGLATAFSLSLASRPRAASSRSGDVDLVASII